MLVARRALLESNTVLDCFFFALKEIPANNFPLKIPFLKFGFIFDYVIFHIIFSYFHGG